VPGYYAGFSHQAQSWRKTGRVVVKVERHSSDFARASASSSPTWRARLRAASPSTTSAAGRSKKGKGVIKWTRLLCRTFAANIVRLQLHALAYNLGNFMRTLAIPMAAEPWSPMRDVRLDEVRAMGSSAAGPSGSLAARIIPPIRTLPRRSTRQIYCVSKAWGSGEC
jgi:hypothetical protein